MTVWAAAQTVFIPAKKVPSGFSLFSFDMLSFKDGSRPGLLEKTMMARFGNSTDYEIESIVVRYAERAESGKGKVLVLSPKITLRNFVGTVFPHVSSILPYDMNLNRTFRVEFENKYWTTDSGDDLELIGINVYKNPDLHDPGHLFTYMLTHPAKEMIAKFKADPTLLRVTNSHRYTTFLVALTVGSLEVIKYVEAHGGKWTEKTSDGSMPIHFAAVNEPNVIQYALGKGQKLEAKNKWGYTPLTMAVLIGSQKTVEYLLKCHANPNVKTILGNTTITGYAIFYHSPELLKLLVRYGASPKFLDPFGYNWYYASPDRDTRMWDTILHFGIPVDQPTKGGMTPLMYAAQHQFNDFATWLIRRGANAFRKDKRGRNAFDYSVYSNTLHSRQFFQRVYDKAIKMPKLKG